MNVSFLHWPQLWFIRVLESKKKELGVTDMLVSLTTLEEVFLRITEEAERRKELNEEDESDEDMDSEDDDNDDDAKDGVALHNLK